MMMYFPSVPISFAVEITYECNNVCPGCANVLGKRRGEILQNWRQVFDTIAPPEDRHKYAELIRITGGEPTLHPEFSRIIAYIDTFGIAHATFTNGRWNDPDRIVATLQQCTNSAGLLVSLHGSTATTHNAFTGGDDTAFNEIRTNIRRATNAGLEVFTNTVLTKYNCDQIDEIIDLSQQLGADYAVFNRYLGKTHPVEPTEEQLYQALHHIEQLHKEGVPCRIGDCVPPCFLPNSSLGSNGGIEHCAISPLGDVRPENLTRYRFGNLFEQSLEEIWQSEDIRWYRQQIPKACFTCAELSRCRGGCLSVIVEYGLEKDRLMKEPIRELRPDTIELAPDWKPVPYFTVRQESFGYLLARYNWSVPVSSEAKPLLDAINGNHSLIQLQDRFGDDALEFIGQLYREGCLGFAIEQS